MWGYGTHLFNESVTATTTGPWTKLPPMREAALVLTLSGVTGGAPNVTVLLETAVDADGSSAVNAWAPAAQTGNAELVQAAPFPGALRRYYRVTVTFAGTTTGATVALRLFAEAVA